MTKTHTTVADLTSLTEKQFEQYGNRLFGEIPEVAKQMLVSILTQPLVTVEVRELMHAGGSTYEKVTFNEASVTDLAVGDLVMVYEPSRGTMPYANRFKGQALGEFADRWNKDWALNVVVKRTAKGAEIQHVDTAAHHYSYGIVGTREWTERIQDSSKRMVFKTGMTYADFEDAMLTHEKSHRLQMLLADASAWDTEHERRAQVKEDAKKNLTAPFIAHAEAVRKGVGDQVFVVSGDPSTGKVTSSRAYTDWIRKVPTSVLRYVIEGRRATGAITDEQANAALEGLTVLNGIEK